MAIIVYRCSGCNRLLQLKENERGLTTVGLCTITQGCTGQLIQIDRVDGTATPPLAERIPDVANRQPRNVLYNHVQNITSNVWTVTHNLGANPVVQVAVERPGFPNGVEIEPQAVEIIDKNTTRITFDRAEAGVAQFISRSASSSDVVVEVAETEYFQLSTDGVITVATFTMAANLGINYIVEGVETPVLYPVTYPPTTESPWSDATTVVNKGREFFVGVIDVSVPPILEAGSFYFDDGVYPTADTFILLSLSPYNNVDKIKRQVMFVDGIGADESLTSFSYMEGEHYAVDTIIEQVYPPVFIVS